MKSIKIFQDESGSLFHVELCDGKESTRIEFLSFGLIILLAESWLSQNFSIQQIEELVNNYTNIIDSQ